MPLTRLTLLIIALIIGAGFCLLVRRQLDEVEPQTFQATEVSMVDAAHLLASLVEADLDDGKFRPDPLRVAFEPVGARSFEALIYQHLKRRVGIQAYVSDSRGIVLSDPDGGRREGSDLSRFRDVKLTLEGKSRFSSNRPFAETIRRKDRVKRFRGKTPTRERSGLRDRGATQPRGILADPGPRFERSEQIFTPKKSPFSAKIFGKGSRIGGRS